MTKHIYFVFTLCLLIPDVVFSAMEAKIVGGFPVRASKYPFAVQISNMDSMCGGSIISSQAVLSAAHCFVFNKVAEDILIRTGESVDAGLDMSPQGIYLVWDIHTHEKYDNEVYSSDIAIVFASTPFTLTATSHKVLLVNTAAWMRTSEKFTAIGWGWTAYGGPVSPGLKMTHLKFVRLGQCSNDHNSTMTKDMFCLYGDGETDTCRGDSGSGVTWKGKLVGVVSHGDGCAQKDKPSVYSNVWFFRNWIKQSLLKFHRNYCKYNISDGTFSTDW